MSEPAEPDPSQAFAASERRLESRRAAKARLEGLVSRRRKRRFYYGRLVVLMGAFLLVALWAARDIKQRRSRTEWNRTLKVALVVVLEGKVEPAAIASLRSRVDALGTVLEREYRRYRTDTLVPFRFRVYGPVEVWEAPPDLADDTVVSLVRYTFERWLYLRNADDPIGLDRSNHDSVIYLVARPPASQQVAFVEGASEAGGRIGLVRVELHAPSVDTALFVVAHELFHTLGASDKYDSWGRTWIPKGLAEPDKVPLFPQEYAELMARNIVYSLEEERAPGNISQLRVGPITADEVDWR